MQKELISHYNKGTIVIKSVLSKQKEKKICHFAVKMFVIEFFFYFFKLVNLVASCYDVFQFYLSPERLNWPVLHTRNFSEMMKIKKILHSNRVDSPMN